MYLLVENTFPWAAELTFVHVTVKCYGAARAAVGETSVDVQVMGGASVGDVFAVLTERYPEFAAVRESDVVVMRRGTHIDETDAVADGDQLNISNQPMVED